MTAWSITNSWGMSTTIEAENRTDALEAASKTFGLVVGIKPALAKVAKIETKPLRSTAPEFLILNPNFNYTSSLATDVRATFAAQRLKLAAQKASQQRNMAAQNDAAADGPQLGFAF